METMTISQVSKTLGVSTRMLRYYEKAGLIKSCRREGYAYRVYDEKAVSQIKQILLLRRLRVSLRQIKKILENSEAVTALEIFQQNISELDEEITDLSTIKSILERFVETLSETAELPYDSIITQDDTILASIESLSLISINFKQDQRTERMKKSQ